MKEPKCSHLEERYFKTRFWFSYHKLVLTVAAGTLHLYYTHSSFLNMEENFLYTA